MIATDGFRRHIPSSSGDRVMIGTSSRGNISPLVSFRGAVPLKPEIVCDAETNCILEEWNARRGATPFSLDLFRGLGAACMSVDVDCLPVGYFPDEQSNTLSETLMREFLFPDGFRQLGPGPALVWRAQYSLIALEGCWHLLVCPAHNPRTGHPDGATVVHIDRHLTGKAIERNVHRASDDVRKPVNQTQK